MLEEWIRESLEPVDSNVTAYIVAATEADKDSLELWFDRASERLRQSHFLGFVAAAAGVLFCLVRLQHLFSFM